jgi:hypothetical protein
MREKPGKDAGFFVGLAFTEYVCSGVNRNCKNL